MEITGESHEKRYLVKKAALFMHGRRLTAMRKRVMRPSIINDQVSSQLD